MKYVLTSDQKHHFDTYGFVILQEVVPEKKMEELLHLIEGVIPKDGLFYGRDCALRSQGIQKILFSRAISSLAHELCNKEKLRYAADWVWQGQVVPWNESDPKLALASCLSIQPLAIGCVLALTDALESHEMKNGEWFLPLKKGDICFIRSDMCGHPSLQDVNQKFCALLYAEHPVLYIRNELDPHTHLLKELGYVFGDRLKETTHPFLFR